MPIEVERKFLVLEHDPARLRDGQPVEQGYLSLDPVVRVRVRGGEGTLTVKGPGLGRRAEYEYTIPVEDARELLELCLARLEKVRYIVGPIEIDVFGGPLEGLVLAEVEGAGDEDLVAAPEWLIWVEVTADPEYQNANLARRATSGEGPPLPPGCA